MLKLKVSKDSPEKKKSPRAQVRLCNLCGEGFRALTPHCCFCDECKLHSDLYRFHDWLPDQLNAA